jgi:hypothetical protein
MRLTTEHIVSSKGQSSGQAASTLEDSDQGAIGSLQYRLSAKSILLWLMILTLALNGIGAVGRGIEYLLGIKETTELVRLVHVGQEGNLTTWFSAMLLLCSSILLAVIAKANHVQGKPYVWHWAIMSVIFFLMNLDEAARIHELTIEPLRSLFHTSGIFHHAWVILAIPFVLVFVIAYAKFLLDLPRDTRLLLIVAGGLYVLGAVGMDLPAGYLLSREGGPGLIEAVLITIEELLENVGAVVFIYALVSHMRSHVHVSEVQFHIV